jgi:hypothetical protein
MFDKSLKINTFMQQPDPHLHTETPLDQPENPSPTHPAVKWLMVYGGYLLVAKILQSLLPIVLQNFGGGNPMNYYRNTNLIFGLGEIAVMVAIVINVKHPLCRILFSVLALLNFVLVAGTQYAMMKMN